MTHAARSVNRETVRIVRHLLATRHLAVLVCVATLLLKLLVPTGYMLDSDGGRLVVVSCPSMVPHATSMDMPGMHGDGAYHGKSGDHGKADTPCAFAGLSAAITGAVDPVQLAALIAFIVSVGLVLSAPPPRPSRTHLRPPLRGPPTCL